MKILILGSVALPVPPPMQGGTERIAYWQALGLSARKNDITLIAAKGSKENPAYTLVQIGGGDTVTGSERAQVLPLTSPNATHEGTPAVGAPRFASPAQLPTGNFTEGSRNLRKEAIYLAEVSQYILDHGKEYDVILNNMRAGESLFVPVAKSIGVPYATVMHLPMFSELADYFRATDTSVITISNAQREGFDGVRYAGTVYNCVEPELLKAPISSQSGKYLLMMGSIAPHKNQKDGILAAKALGKQIILAGKVGNQAYWDTEIGPVVDGTSVVHKGEMGLDEKTALLAGAEALLFPITWPEPFGLVMIEAMAVGTPVVAYGNGAVPEVVLDGKTGFIVDQSQGVGGLAVGIERIKEIDREACRTHVAEHFTVEKMIESLETALQKVATR
jgi:glycosyltransferase involved in cell wall biosynthesis